MPSGLLSGSSNREVLVSATEAPGAPTLFGWAGGEVWQGACHQLSFGRANIDSSSFRERRTAFTFMSAILMARLSFGSSHQSNLPAMLD